LPFLPQREGVKVSPPEGGGFRGKVKTLETCTLGQL